MDSNSPAYKPARYQRFEPLWEMLDRVWESLAFPDDMRQYLKKKPEESPKDYEARLSFSALENRYRPTITSNATLLSQFGLTEDVPENIRRHESDIDGHGTNLTTFVFDLAEKLLRYDSVFILVDTQKPNPDAPIRTELDLRLSGKRPTLRLVGVQGLQNGRLSKDGSIEQVVFCHTETVPDGNYGEKEEKQYWRYQRGALDKLRINEKSGTVENIEPTTIYSNSQGGPLGEVPLVWVSASKKPPLDLGVPYFLSLAKLNIQHLIKTSELDDIEFKCNNPTPLRKWPGPKPQGAQKLIMGKVIDCENGGEVSFLEPSGAAIGSTHARNLDREAKMDRIGTSFLTGGDSAKTATEAKINMSQSMASLKGFGEIIESAMEEAFRLWGLYSGDAMTGGIRISDDALAVPPDSSMISAVIGGMVQQAYSRRYALMKLNELGFQPDGIDIEEELNQANLLLQQDIN